MLREKNIIALSPSPASSHQWFNVNQDPYGSKILAPKAYITEVKMPQTIEPFQRIVQERKPGYALLPIVPSHGIGDSFARISHH